MTVMSEPLDRPRLSAGVALACRPRAAGGHCSQSLAPLLVLGAWPRSLRAWDLGSPPRPTSPDGLPPLSSPLMMAQMMLGQLLSLAHHVGRGGLAWRETNGASARAAANRMVLQAAGLGALLVVLILPLEVLFYRLAGLGLFSDSGWLLEGLRSPLLVGRGDRSRRARPALGGGDLPRVSTVGAGADAARVLAGSGRSRRSCGRFCIGAIHGPASPSVFPGRNRPSVDHAAHGFDARSGCCPRRRQRVFAGR